MLAAHADRSASSSTKRTACRSGATTSVPRTSASSDADRALGTPPVLALTATATPKVVDDIAASLGLRDPRGHQHRHLSTEPAARGLRTASEERETAAARRAASRRAPARHRLRRDDPACGRGARRAARARLARRALSRPRARARARATSQDASWRATSTADGRDQRVRHGDRQAGRPLRHALQPARLARSLLSGGRPCRPRRRAGALRALLPDRGPPHAAVLHGRTLPVAVRRARRLRGAPQGRCAGDARRDRRRSRRRRADEDPRGARDAEGGRIGGRTPRRPLRQGRRGGAG